MLHLEDYEYVTKNVPHGAWYKGKPRQSLFNPEERRKADLTEKWAEQGVKLEWLTDGDRWLLGRVGYNTAIFRPEQIQAYKDGILKTCPHANPKQLSAFRSGRNPSEGVTPMKYQIPDHDVPQLATDAIAKTGIFRGVDRVTNMKTSEEIFRVAVSLGLSEAGLQLNDLLSGALKIDDRIFPIIYMAATFAGIPILKAIDNKWGKGDIMGPNVVRGLLYSAAYVLVRTIFSRVGPSRGFGVTNLRSFSTDGIKTAFQNFTNKLRGFSGIDLSGFRSFEGFGSKFKTAFGDQVAGLVAGKSADETTIESFIPKSFGGLVAGRAESATEIGQKIMAGIKGLAAGRG